MSEYQPTGSFDDCLVTYLNNCIKIFIEAKIREIVKRETELALKELETELREKTAGLALDLTKLVSYNMHEQDLIITIRDARKDKPNV